MFNVGNNDYITMIQDNTILISFQDIDIVPNDFPEEFQIINNDGRVIGRFKVIEPSYDETRIIRNVRYEGTFMGAKGWTAMIYNMEDTDEID